jgi:mannose-1-phosphate guanylyltransferase
VTRVADVVGMILCAGLGTRLRPLTEVVPKPAVPVAGIPLVRWNLALLAAAGVRRAVVNTHHLAERMGAEARAAADALGVALAVSHEAAIAGTGGALREARRHLAGADAVVLVNGDVLFDLDLAEALRVHRQTGARATMVLAPMPAGARYAAVEVDAAGLVRRIAGRFGPGGDGLRPFHFTGVHLLSPALLDDVPAFPYELDVNRQVHPLAMERPGGVRGFLQEGYWNDLGTPARYLAANLDVAAGRVPLARFGVDPRAAAAAAEGGGSLVDATARVHPSARIERACIGAGATVGPGCVVRDAVVWEGTALHDGERVERAIAAGPLRVDAAGD